MASFKESFSKGLTTINVKTSNFMEENKFRTQISTLESEIEKLKFTLGEIVYKNWDTESFSLQSVSEEVALIKKKYETIEQLKVEIEMLSQKEKQILGQNENANNNANTGKIFCTNCGNEVKKGYKFCEKCGNKLEE